MQEKIKQIQEQLETVIVGKEDVIAKVIMAILAKGHVLLDDVPGVGKTTLAMAISKVFDLSYHRVQFTPDTMASDLVGFSMLSRQTEEMKYVPGAVFCNLLLADEINRTSAKTQSALLEVMEERRVTVDGITHKLPEPFICIATQNPFGSVGTQKLPDSQLDRFMVCLSLGYPTVEEQIEIVRARMETNPLDLLSKALSAADLLEMTASVKACRIEDDVIGYAARLCERTRQHEDIMQGVSPRGVMALIEMAKAKAFMDGRDYCIPADIASLFPDVCAHRIVLTSKAKVHHVTAAELLLAIVKETEPPKILARG